MEPGTMYINFGEEIAAQHVAELHREAAKQRLVRRLRASRTPTNVQRRRIWERLTFRCPQPAVMTKTPLANGPVVARTSPPAARQAG
jgi:hypothetical protein